MTDTVPSFEFSGLEVNSQDLVHHRRFEKVENDLLGFDIFEQLGTTPDKLPIISYVYLSQYEYINEDSKPYWMGYSHYSWNRSTNSSIDPRKKVAIEWAAANRPILIKLGNSFNYFASNSVSHIAGLAERVVGIKLIGITDKHSTCKVMVSFRANNGCIIAINMSLGAARTMLGLRLDEQQRLMVNDLVVDVGAFNIMKNSVGNVGYYSNGLDIQHGFDFTKKAVSEFFFRFPEISDEEKNDALRRLEYLLVKQPSFQMSGIAKTFNRTIDFAIDLFKRKPLAYVEYISLAELSPTSTSGVKYSTVFNELFVGVDNQNAFDAVMDTLLKSNIEESATFKAKRKKVLSGQTDRAFRKLQEEVESLDLDPKKYKLLYKAITDAEIPLGIFFRKKEQYFLLNDNFPLWEEMLRRHYDETCRIARSVAKRSTYEKDLMSYFYFLLHDLPEYMRRQTGEKWTCRPRLVNSENDLDADREDVTGKTSRPTLENVDEEVVEVDQEIPDDGILVAEGQPKVQRKRSALTPTADNVSKVVTVPFASFHISGYQTQYCYSHSYHVLRRGFTYKGNTVMNDAEVKLNGRDDYGLMFYTLTGSETARGYPTFLIIFEKRKGGTETHVHFHRTHPCRSKDGDYNPVHNWVRVSYNWMAGNVRANRLKYQQGDLIFATMDAAKADKIEFHERVQRYDNHCFSELVEFSPFSSSDKSKNILGYVRLSGTVTLQHHEHEHVPMQPGTYEILQARSFEANPRGIWTLRID